MSSALYADYALISACMAMLCLIGFVMTGRTVVMPPPPQPAPRGGGRGSMPLLMSGNLEIGPMVRALLAGLRGPARAHRVRFQVAVVPGLRVHADPVAVQGILTVMLETALRQGAGGEVLVTAGLLGGKVQIAVAHDNAQADSAGTEARLREAAQVAALHGGTLLTDCRAGQGVVMALRLARSPAASAAPVPAEA